MNSSTFAAPIHMHLNTNFELDSKILDLVQRFSFWVLFLVFILFTVHCSLENDFENWNRYVFFFKWKPMENMDCRSCRYISFRYALRCDVALKFSIEHNAISLLIMKLNVLAFGVFKIQIAERSDVTEHWTLDTNYGV